MCARRLQIASGPVAKQRTWRCRGQRSRRGCGSRGRAGGRRRGARSTHLVVQGGRRLDGAENSSQVRVHGCCCSGQRRAELRADEVLCLGVPSLECAARVGPCCGKRGHGCVPSLVRVSERSKHALPVHACKMFACRATVSCDSNRCPPSGGCTALRMHDVRSRPWTTPSTSASLRAVLWVWGRAGANRHECVAQADAHGGQGRTGCCAHACPGRQAMRRRPLRPHSLNGHHSQ